MDDQFRFCWERSSGVKANRLEDHAFRGVTGSRATTGSVSAWPYVSQDSVGSPRIRSEWPDYSQGDFTFCDLSDLAEVTRPSRSGDFIRWQRSSKFWHGPFQRR